MDRLDRLMAELDDAVARLDVRAPGSGPDQPVPAAPRARVRWYWTMPATTVPPAPEADRDVADASPPP
jgi:hypothetical protein